MKKFWMIVFGACGLFGTLLAQDANVPPASVPAAATEFRDLVRGNKFLGKIYVADDAPVADVYAAEDLAEWIERVCGTGKLAVWSERFFKSETPAIFVGGTRAAADAGISPPAAGEESYIAVSRGNSIFIVGKTPVALRHAVSAFLHNIFGVSFIFPGKDGAEWTPLSDVAFPREPIVCVPAWTWRHLWLIDTEWAAHLGFGALPRFSHNLSNIFTPDVYAAHPELSPIFNGKKITNVLAQPNLANPLAVKIAADAAKDFFNKNPKTPIFSLGINDSSAWDESAESKDPHAEMDWFRNLPDRSDYYYSFVNAVAKLSPQDKKISAIAYLDVQNVPSFPVEKNVLPVLCADRSMWVFPDFRKDDMALMERWSKSGVENFGIYDYYYGSPFFFPRLFFKEQAESIRYAHSLGARLFFAEGVSIPAFDAPKIWLASRLLANPLESPNAVLNEFYALAYGGAQQEMRDFFETCAEIWSSQGGQYRWLKGWNRENAVEIFSLKNCAKLRTILNRARATMPKNPTSPRDVRIVKRIESVSKHFERAEKFAARYYAKKNLSTAKLLSSQDIIAALENPAWRMEKMYRESDYASLQNRANLGLVRISDPRAGTLYRLVEALAKMQDSPERMEAEARLEQLLKNRRGDDSDRALDLCRKMLPQLRGVPLAEEDFEPESERSPKDGEFVFTSKLIPIGQSGWAKGKLVCSVKNWGRRISPAENLYAGETQVAHSGKTALQISGRSELWEAVRTFRLPAGTRTAAAVIWARGKVSCGATAAITLTWLDARGRLIGSRARAELPVGETESWIPLIALGEAPAGAVEVCVFITAANQGIDDEACFDDFAIYAY